MMRLSLLLPLVFCSALLAQESDGKKVFETHCWGCHHQTAVAFGPPFSEIADKRTKDEIKAYVISPESMYKAFGYKRTVMTQFNLSDQDLDLISDYILTYKGTK